MTKYVTAIHELHYAIDGKQIVRAPKTVFSRAEAEAAGFPESAYREASEAETAIYEKTEGLTVKAEAKVEPKQVEAPKRVVGKPVPVVTGNADGDEIK